MVVAFCLSATGAFAQPVRPARTDSSLPERCTKAISTMPPIRMDRSTRRTVWADTIGQKRDVILVVLKHPPEISSAPRGTEVWTYDHFLMADYTVCRLLDTRLHIKLRSGVVVAVWF
jgi:hypothetical protein